MALPPPLLTEAQVKALATEQSFERGEQYYDNGAIFNPRIQGYTLWANCSGTTIYQPRVTLEAEGVEDCSCTCPYDWGGLCKHLVALLLTYIRDRDQFQVIQPLPELLAQRSRDELLTLIEGMVQRHPDLLDLVDVSVVPAPGQTPNVDQYRQLAERVFQGSEMETMATALESLAEVGHTLVQAGDSLQGGDVYQLLLEVANDCYNHIVLDVDYDGQVGLVIQDIARGLSDSLGQVKNLDIGRHRLWIETCFWAVLKDLELGGMDYAYPAWEALVTHSTDEDWAWVDGQVRQILEGKGQQSVRNWGRSRLVTLLIERAKYRGQTAIAQAIILDLGTPEQRAFYHLREGNIEEGLTIARSHFKSLPGLVIQFADALLQAQQPDLALAFVAECQQHQNHYGYQEWQLKVLQTHGQPEQVIAAQAELLQLRFSLQGYQSLQAEAEPLGQWTHLRQQLLATLKQKKNVTALLDIALLEQDWQTALGYLKQVTYWQKTDYQIRVAKALEADQPETAIALYQELIEALIRQRGRDNYQQAAQHLKTIQRLSKTTKDKVAFQQYVDHLRTQNKTLRALKEELTRAGL